MYTYKYTFVCVYIYIYIYIHINIHRNEYIIITLKCLGPFVDACASNSCPTETVCMQTNNTHYKCVCQALANGEYYDERGK